jgi:hypothetical protein
MILLSLLACAPDPLMPEADNAVTGSIDGAAGLTIAGISGEEVFMADIAGDGSFNLTLPDGDFSIALLDGDLSPVALLVADDTTMIAVDGGRSLGALSWDVEGLKLTGGPSSARGEKLDLSDMVGITTARHSTGGSGLPLDELSGDRDGDGVPDLLDNDTNENGLYDSVEGGRACAVRIESLSERPEDIPDEAWTALKGMDCAVFDNLKLMVTEVGMGDGDMLPQTDDHVLTLHLAPPAALTPYIDHVEAARIPAFADGLVSHDAGGWTFASYPTVGSDWSSHGYELPLAAAPDGSDVYSIWIAPNTDPRPSLFQLRVTLIDGSTALLTPRMFFVFHTAPRMTALSDAAGSTAMVYPLTEGDDGSASSPIVLDGSGTYTLTADRPLDRAGGSEICGMNISAEIFYEDTASSQLNTLAVNTGLTPDTGACDPAVDITVDIDGADLPTTWDATPIDSYRIALMVSSHHGDNAAAAMWATY